MSNEIVAAETQEEFDQLMASPNHEMCPSALGGCPPGTPDEVPKMHLSPGPRWNMQCDFRNGHLVVECVGFSGGWLRRSLLRLLAWGVGFKATFVEEKEGGTDDESAGSAQ